MITIHIVSARVRLPIYTVHIIPQCASNSTFFLVYSNKINEFHMFKNNEKHKAAHLNSKKPLNLGVWPLHIGLFFFCMSRVQNTLWRLSKYVFIAIVHVGIIVLSIL